jgi:hypothetical protein
MAIKDFFKKDYVSKAVTIKSVDAIGQEVESADYVESHGIDRNRFVPHVDYSSPANFAKFGSAQKYYEDSITRIYSTYPFDGSLKEKLDWHNTGSHLDNYIFDKEYPRTNGYARFSPDGPGTIIASSSAGFAAVASASMEYIQVKGGPNVGPGGTYVGANILDSTKARESNLRFGGDQGNTVEFWLKKGEPQPYPTGSAKEAIFDLWNGETVSHLAGSQYGRLLIYVDGEVAAPSSCLKVTYVSGTVSACTDQAIGTSGTTDTGSLFADSEQWNHYALSFVNAGNDLELTLYLNGELNDTLTVNNGAINEVTGALIANIGSLRTQTTPSESPAADNGWGKLSGSLDEFRFWKTKRTSKQVSRYWFDQVGGGTNTDTANTSLGVYFKFNEGIVGDTATDAVVLDYSGRLSHGAWVGYGSTTLAQRSTSSAIVEAGASPTEFQDPILYPDHPDVVQLLADKREIGFSHDSVNNSSIYHTLPEWISTEDEEKEKRNALNLTQIMASVFDDLYQKIDMLPKLSNVDYVSGSQKPFPFADRLLESKGFVAPEIFSNAEIIAQLSGRDEKRLHEQKLHDIKNLIYHNIHNNLVYIYKSKGTEKAFRNLIRCFGVDDELVRVNLYGDNVDFEIKPNFRLTSGRKKYIDFNNVDRFAGTVYQYIDTNNPNSVSYISGSSPFGETKEEYLPFTMEAEVILPKKFEQDSPLYFSTPFVSSSLFGIHSPVTGALQFLTGGIWGKGIWGDEFWGGEQTLTFPTTWADNDYASFQVYAVRDRLESKDVYFVLTGSALGVELTTPLFRDQYENERWNFAVRIKSSRFPNANIVSGTVGSSFDLEFYGVSTVLDRVQNEFTETASVSFTNGSNFLTSPKRCYIGSHRTDFTGSLLARSDAKISSVRVWMDYLDNEVIKAHARDVTNFGSSNPYRNAFLTQDSTNDFSIPQAESLVLHWDFSKVTGSGPSSGPLVSDAKFDVDDLSSGSINDGRYGWFSQYLSVQHTGRGDFFIANEEQVVDKEYVASAKQKLPETLDSYDMVEILRKDDEYFTRESRPIKHFFAVEKSMYQTISEEMVNLFATINDFNNLIGEPVNRYRMEYKDLAKLRQLFFERIGNVPDIEKYVEFYKWIDNALSIMIKKLIPMSANFSDDIRTMIESHVLERNKYWTKYPTLELKTPDPEAGMVSINKHLYSWQSGSAPVGGEEDKNTLWWKERAERTNPTISVQDDVDETRAAILNRTLTTLRRSWTTPNRFDVNRENSLSGSYESFRIENVKTIYTSSYIAASTSNYTNDWEVVQTSGRRYNNRALVDAEGVGFQEIGIGSLENLSDYYEGVYDYAKLQRGRNPHVFVERFSAPGGPDTAGDSNGGLGLDRISGEYSIYNNINYRNLLVRIPLRQLLSEHCGQFGIDKDASISSDNYSVQPSYHKVNRNPWCVKRVNIDPVSLAETVIEETNYDNWFIQHQIPQSDAQYSWVTSSMEGTLCGFATGSEDITFVSQSSVGSWLDGSTYAYGYDQNSPDPVSNGFWIPVDFAGMNSVIYEPVSGSENTLGFPEVTWWHWVTGTPVSGGFCNYVSLLTYLNLNTTRGGLLNQDPSNYEIGMGSLLNGILLHRNGPYGWPSWKQIRVGETAIPRFHKKNNIISIVDPTEAKEIVKITSTGDRERYTSKAIRSGTIRNYTEPPVTMRYKPIIHELIVESNGEKPLLLKYSHGNLLSSFANTELVNKLDTAITEKQTYDKLVKKYTEDADDPSNPIKQFSSLIYGETIFPKETNSFLGKIRDRVNWEQNSWRDSRTERTPELKNNVVDIPGYSFTAQAGERKTSLNSQGNRVTQSMWLLDANLNYDSDIVDRDGASLSFRFGNDYLGAGELQNNYTTFFSSSVIASPTTASFIYKPDPTLIGNRVGKVLAFNDYSDKIDAADLSVYNAAICITPNLHRDASDTCTKNYWDYMIGDYATGLHKKVVVSAWVNPRMSLILQPTYRTIVEFGDHKRWFGLKRQNSTLSYPCFRATWSGGVAEWVSTDVLLQQDGKNWYHVVVEYYPGILGTDTTQTASFWVNGQRLTTTTVTAPNGTIDSIVDGYGGVDEFGADLGLNGSFIGSSSFNRYPYEGLMYGVSVHNELATSNFTNDEVVKKMYNGGYPTSLYSLPNFPLSDQQEFVGSSISWWLLGDGYRHKMTGDIYTTVDTFQDKRIYAQYDIKQTDIRSDRISRTSLEGLDDYFGVPSIHVADMIGNFAHGGAIQLGVFAVADREFHIRPNAYEVGYSNFGFVDAGSNFLYGAADARDGFYLEGKKNGVVFARKTLEYDGTPWVGFSLTSSLSSKASFPCVDLYSGRNERLIRVTGSQIISGDVKWTAPEEAGKQPYFESFDRYNQDIRNVGKGYSIVPEFRISEHMNKYVEGGSDFLLEVPEFLSITGSSVQDSSEEDFYRTYSHSDFMKYFDMIKEEHEGVVQPSSFKLKCKAMMKFIPYEGFYPAQRCLQLATLFSQSYGELVRPKLNSGYPLEDSTKTNASWRAFTTPIFGPGILMNSIKSGMAVDFPIYGKEPPKIIEDFKSGVGGGADFRLKQDTRFLDNYDRTISRYWYGSSSAGVYGIPISGNYHQRFTDYGEMVDLRNYHSTFFGIDPIEQDSLVEWKTCLNSDFSERIPFEALVEPENFLAKKIIWDMEPEYSASFRRVLGDDNTSYGAFWGGDGSSLYKLAMHNFLAEVPSFFLRGGQFTTFSSRKIPPEGIRISEEQKDKIFGMDVVVSNGSCRSYTEWNKRARLPEFSSLVESDYKVSREELDRIKGIHTKIYERDSAFGPPWVSSVSNSGFADFFPEITNWPLVKFEYSLFTDASNAFSYHYGYEPFTPPYFNGFGLARLLFFPYKGAGNYTLDEIFNNTTSSFLRMPTDRTGLGGVFLTEKLLEFMTLASSDANLTNGNIKDKVPEELYTTKGLISGDSAQLRLFPISQVSEQYIKTNNNWMQISASLNLFNKTKLKKVTYERGEIQEYEPASIESDETTSDVVWSIQPKWETPIFNFFNKNTASLLPQTGAGGFSRGIWHQYGEFCTGSEGIWMQVRDIPDNPLFTSEDCEGATFGAIPTSASYDGAGCAYLGQSENEYSDVCQNAKVYLYILDKTQLNGECLSLANVTITGSTSFGVTRPQFYIGSTNYRTAENILNTLKQKDVFDPTDTELRGDGEDPPVGVSRIIDLENARIFYPDEHPWSYDASLVPSGERVVAIEFTINDCVNYPPLADPFLGSFEEIYKQGTLGSKDYLPRETLLLKYPDFFANGPLGNKLVALLVEEGTKTRIDDLEGSYFYDGTRSPVNSWALGGAVSETNQTFTYGTRVNFYGGQKNTKKVESLADLMGFNKVQKRLGEVEEQKTIREAVIAVPFVEKNNDKQFFRIKRRLIDIASGKISPRQGEELPGDSIQDMVESLQRYVIPPKMDFLTYDSITPFAMYVFEFEHTLSAQDLRDIWQNLPPDLTETFQAKEAIIEHEILENELLNGDIETNLRWMIFKVKQKGEKNYFAKTSDTQDDARFKFNFDIGSENSAAESVPKYSYNWPYDFFSIVELVKIDAEVQFDTEEEGATNTINPIPGITNQSPTLPPRFLDNLGGSFSKPLKKLDPVLPPISYSRFTNRIRSTASSLRSTFVNNLARQNRNLPFPFSSFGRRR